MEEDRLIDEMREVVTWLLGARLVGNELRAIQAAETVKKAVNSHASLVEEVERLRKALATFVDEYVEMVNSGDCGFWDPEKEDKVVAVRKALEKSNA